MRSPLTPPRRPAPIAAIAGLALTTAAAAQPLDWWRGYNGPVSQQDVALAVAVTPDGGSVVTGPSKGLGTGWDFATVKFDADGNQQWAARYSNPGADDVPVAIGVDAQGNVYVTGDSWGGLSPSGSDWDYATVKYSPSGQELWVRRYNGPGNSDDLPSHLVVDDAGNVYIAGYSFKEPMAGGFYASHFHILKYDTHGEIVWQHHLSGTPHLGAGANDITLDAQGNVYATGGLRNNNPSFGPDPNIFTVKVDPAGDIVYAVQYSTPGFNTEHDNGMFIAVDSQGNAFVTGQTLGGAERSWDTTTLKYDPSGGELWVRSLDLNRPDGPTAIDVDQAGNVYIGGIWNKATDDDGFALSYSPTGAQRWLRLIDGGQTWGSDATYGLRVGPDGDIYAASEIDHSTGVNLALARFTAAGDHVGTTHYNTSPGDLVWGENTCLAFAPDGSAYIAGSRDAGAVNSTDFVLVKTQGSITPACYANCDQSTQSPVLNVADFSCFLQKFAAGDAYANCDQSTQAPALNVADFSCFLQKFAAGCP